mmetsp:Transcript_353/g.1018  ORF Transcript_353/g.1018 Transcript_353/m.1018 type:complete len:277 (-) Transcript_353:189-1019(-)
MRDRLSERATALFSFEADELLRSQVASGSTHFAAERRSRRLRPVRRRSVRQLSTPPPVPLVILEVKLLRVHAILVDDPDVHVVARRDVALASRGEGVLDDVNHLLARVVDVQRRWLGPVLLVLPLEQVVEHRLNQLLCRAVAAHAYALDAAHHVKGVHATHAVLVEPGNDVLGEQREETAVVQHLRDQLRDGRRLRLLAVRVLVLHDARAHQLLQLERVRLAVAARPKHGLLRHLEELAHVAALDLVADAHARVTRDHGEVLAADRHHRARVHHVG